VNSQCPADSEFSPGEIAILTCDGQAGRTGDEVEVLSRFFFIRDYIVRGVNGKPVVCKPQHLRKKRPPQEPSSWSEVEKLCKWRPAGVRA
jgi:hypothetical protein